MEFEYWMTIPIVIIVAILAIGYMFLTMIKALDHNSNLFKQFSNKFDLLSSTFENLNDISNSHVDTTIAMGKVLQRIDNSYTQHVKNVEAVQSLYFSEKLKNTLTSNNNESKTIRHKYVRIDDSLGQGKAIILFPEYVQHSKFKNWNCISAGFCDISNGIVNCYGKSTGLGISSKTEDTGLLLKQFYGWNDFLKYETENKESKFSLADNVVLIKRIPDVEVGTIGIVTEIYDHPHNRNVVEYILSDGSKVKKITDDNEIQLLISPFKIGDKVETTKEALPAFKGIQGVVVDLIQITELVCIEFNKENGTTARTWLNFDEVKLVFHSPYEIDDVVELVEDHQSLITGQTGVICELNSPKQCYS